MIGYDKLPKQVTIIEVCPRDGLQNEPEFIETEKKIELVNRLTAAGCKSIEVTSFVHPKWVPQMKDAKEVFQAIEKAGGVTYSALIPNMKGLELALDVGLKEVVTIMSASESHNKKNINRSVSESLSDMEEINKTAAENGVKVRSYIATAFGCPIEGDIPVEKVVEIAEALESYGAYEISLGDTTGMANPALSYRVCKSVTDKLNIASVAAHFHRYQGFEFANILAALQAGITVFDGAAGGLGGCPYAPGATGNAATELIVELLDRIGIATGIDKDKINNCALFAHSLSSYYTEKKSCLESNESNEGNAGN